MNRIYFILIILFANTCLGEDFKTRSYYPYPDVSYYTSGYGYEYPYSTSDSIWMQVPEYFQGQYIYPDEMPWTTSIGVFATQTRWDTSSRRWIITP